LVVRRLVNSRTFLPGSILIPGLAVMPALVDAWTIGIPERRRHRFRHVSEGPDAVKSSARFSLSSAFLKNGIPSPSPAFAAALNASCRIGRSAAHINHAFDRAGVAAQHLPARW